MTQRFTLGQQLAMSANSALASDYKDPYSDALNLESQNVRAAAHLTLLVESVKSAIRQQVLDNLFKGKTSNIVTHKVMSTAIGYDILKQDVLALHAASLHLTTVWEGFLNWLRNEGLSLGIEHKSSDESVRPWYELTVRIMN